MRSLSLGIILVFLSAAAMSAVAAEKIDIIESSVLPLETQEEKTARMAWWTEARFGMFIHFGLYSMPARREWVRRIESIPAETYDAKYLPRFNPDLFDARAWVRAAKETGMKYIVLTTKHHDGFCLWDTKQTDYKITKTPFGRDLVREYVDACHAEGMRVGLYFSLLDWHHPDYPIDRNHPSQPEGCDKMTDEACAKALARLNEGKDPARFRTFMFNQVRELLTEYGKIDILFYDFTYDHPNYNGKTLWDSENLLAMTRRLQPGIIVNDRLGLLNVRGGWDIKTPEQASPSSWVEYNGVRVPWETCQTFSGSWGYARDEATWKDPRQLLSILIDSCSKGGNVILNVGPTARGTFDKRAKSRLASIGEWMSVNGRSIYGCTQPPDEFVAPKNTALTYNPKANLLYVHLLEYPVKVLPIAFADRVAYAQFLHDGSEVDVRIPLGVDGKPRKDVGASLILPVVKPDVEIPVVEMFLK